MSTLPVPLIIQSESDAPEETTGLAEQAGQAAQEGARPLQDLFSSTGDLYNRTVGVMTDPYFLGRVIASIVVIIALIFAYRIITHGIPRLLRWRRRDDDTWDNEMIARVKRQDTAITLIRNALRYVVFVVAVLIVVSIFSQNLLPAATGATVLAAVVGFGAQSFLRDIIAGFSIIFEGQYSVGDFIEVEPQKSAGIVEELGLRMTKIRTLSGELVFIPNGAVMGVTNYVSGQQRYTIEVQLRDREAADRVASSLEESAELYVTPPRLVERLEENDGRVRLRIKAGVLPSMSWLIEGNLTERIKGAAGEESLASEPLISKVDQANLHRLRGLLPEDQRRSE
ncbi:mechanosensitive ion channel family protein [Rubrobacter indicoceani]|uniref:mechanosensitive ion channel family protein n=1 Tax=Rubrobacter indicoceani TaxID=2051957 RepID=UPI000E5BBF4E|nr:mechanosensitive ion channel family protein [Rubrobacter indicoceani]